MNARFADGQPVLEGVLSLVLELDGEELFLDKNVVDGAAAFLVPHGAVVRGAELESLKVRMSPFGPQAEDVRTSGFVDCDLLEQWENQEGFEPKVEADRTHAAVIDRGVTVRGRIVEAATGRGIEGAWVLVEDAFDPAGSRSAVDGSFVVTGRVLQDPDFDEDIEVQAFHPRFRRARATLVLKRATSTYRDVELRMASGVRLRGSVVGANGMPVPRASVVLMTGRRRGQTVDELAQAMTCTTDDGGQFDVWGLEPAARAELQVATRSDGGARHRHGPFSLLSDQSGVVVAMPAMARVRLKPRFADGTEADVDACVVAVLVSGEAQMTLPALDVIPVPVGKPVEIRVVAWKGRDRGSAAFAVVRDVFALAGDVVRDLSLLSLGESAPWPSESVELGEKDRGAYSSSSNVRSPLLAHDFWFEFVDADSSRPLAGSRIKVSAGRGSSEFALGKHARAKLTFASGRQWCRVEVEGYEARCLELRAPTGGSSRVRVEMEKLPQ
ncbi:MAG: hypothetical protein AB8H80_10900 [Planctomycetota bacterium]